MGSPGVQHVVAHREQTNKPNLACWAKRSRYGACVADGLTVDTSVCDGGVNRLLVGVTLTLHHGADAVFHDSHALLVQHASGTFAQVDLRHSHRPIDAVLRVALSWNAVDGVDGALAFVADKRSKWEVPYDDVHPDRCSFVVDQRLGINTLDDKLLVYRTWGSVTLCPTSQERRKSVL
ncbi:hypothetical protein L210DRAFT_2341837 [Boletus edulis BED1]|uniref:Uncharacterized protein n=1 Tax=Boletus edulis BED1 TaxID=1328754 RepID=A0AAD4GCQ3_BOLED|nr:hypothetical protein L210DRAFT_2341837 [Boletus edulis BED1]